MTSTGNREYYDAFSSRYDERRSEGYHKLIDDQAAELLVFVSRSSQNLGIGTELVSTVLQLARDIGFHEVCLSVQSNNTRARHVYDKCGIQLSTCHDPRELEMAADP